MTNTVEIETMCFVYQLQPGMKAVIADEHVIVKATQPTTDYMIAVTYAPIVAPGMTKTIYLGKFEDVKSFTTFNW